MANIAYTGTAPAGASVAVYLRSTTTLATIFSDSGGTPLANPFNADGVTGDWEFWVDEADSVYWVYGNTPGGVPVFQRGAITPGNLVVWVSDGVVEDGGPP